MKKLTYKLTYTIAAICAAVLFIIFSFMGGGIGSAYAATSTTVASFDKTEVLEDLQTATIDGKKFSPVNYPYDSTGAFKHPEILTVVEYCYSYRPAQRDNYALYIYFYNPQALDISTTSKANKITMGVEYGADKDGNTKVENYEKFDLQFCSKSLGDYENLFYKFKVIDHVSADGKTIAQRVNSNERRYDISEVELLTYGDINATAYGVGGTYKFRGYAAGCGADIDGESTLEMTAVEDLETVTLDLAGVKDGVDKRTYWRSNSSSLGAHHQNQINSVFFAIDTNVLEKFGYTLQRIKAEWWEYKTAPTIVIANEDIYNDMSKYCGVKISGYDSSRDWTLYNTDSWESIGSYGDGNWNYKWSWNGDLHTSWGNIDNVTSAYVDTLLPLLFSTNGRSISDFVLTAQKLQSYCETYDKSFEKGHLQINEHDFSADLFADEVDEGRTRGYNLREFDITNPDDYYDLKSYDSTHSWWDKFFDYGFGGKYITTSDSYSDIPPIQMLNDDDFAGSNIANYLKINPDDISKLRDYYNNCVADKNGDGKRDNEVFLFRYASTDYWAEYISARNTHDATLKGLHDNIGEVRQGTEFFDFDILTLTFNKSGNLTTLGVVSSPVDHWSDYTPGIYPEYPDWWEWLKRIISFFLIILLIIVLAVLIPPLGSALLALVALPFKALGWLFRQVGKLFKKKE